MNDTNFDKEFKKAGNAACFITGCSILFYIVSAAALIYVVAHFLAKWW